MKNGKGFKILMSVYACVGILTCLALNKVRSIKDENEEESE